MYTYSLSISFDFLSELQIEIASYGIIIIFTFDLLSIILVYKVILLTWTFFDLFGLILLSYIYSEIQLTFKSENEPFHWTIDIYIYIYTAGVVFLEKVSLET